MKIVGDDTRPFPAAPEGCYAETRLHHLPRAVAHFSPKPSLRTTMKAKIGLALVLTLLSLKELAYAGGIKYIPKELTVLATMQDGGAGQPPVCQRSACERQADCCTGTVCVTETPADELPTEDTPRGVCARMLVQEEGKLCTVTTRSCRGDLQCFGFGSENYPLGICGNPNSVMKRKEYFELCEKTLDCDFIDNLCCREQASGKKKNRRICSYFEDPIEDCVF